MRDALYLIDGYSLIYRSYFAHMRQPLLNSKGQNSSAVYGFFRSLFQLIDNRDPSFLAVVLDSRAPTFRHKRYPLYKANREKAPEDLHAQVPIIEEILEALGIEVLRRDGFEADDIIATLATRCKEEGYECAILTGDKDLLQLVGQGVYVLAGSGWSRVGGRNREGGIFEELDRDKVYEARGFFPEQVVDYLSLAGDSADNVPGVAGVGDKTALKLLGLYPTLEQIYDHLDEIQPESLRKKLAAGRENAFLSQELVTLSLDVPLDADLESLRFRLTPERAIPLLAAQGMRSLVEKLGGSMEEEVELERCQPGMYEIVLNEEALQRWVKEIRASVCFAFDTETTSLNELEAEPLGFSLATAEKKACYIPIRAGGSSVAGELPGLAHYGSDPGVGAASAGRTEVLAEDTVRHALRGLLEDPDLLLIGQNIKYDYKVMRRWGINIRNRLFDTMVAAWLLDSSLASYGMDALAEKFLSYRTIHYKEVVGKGQTLADIDLDQAADYAAEDADITYRLYQYFAPRLEKEDLESLFEELEMPVLRILAGMELTGIRLDPNQLVRYESELQIQLLDLEKQIYSECGHPFNIRSTKELQKVLFEERKLKPIKKIKTGYSTDSQVLEELAHVDGDKVSELVLKHRVLAKLRSTYVVALPRQINPQTGRLHTHYRQTGAATGRLASQDPNLQNIPVREESGRRIRRAFVPEPGFQFLSADYGQIELVILAHLSQDPVLIEAFNEQRDIHRQTAAILFGVEEKDVSADQRRIGKTVNFGVIYGMSAFRLARDLKIGRKEADSFIERYFERYAEVDRFKKETIRKAEAKGYVETLMGRKRQIPQINSRNRTEKMAAERVAVNSPIQGSAADIVKRAMIRISEALGKNNLRTRLLLQVHDELIFEVPDEEIEDSRELIRTTMENTIKLSAPLRVSIETGNSWGDIH